MNMKPTEFSDTKLDLRIEEYFAGQTRPWGIFDKRFGFLRRQFVTNIRGTWDGKQLVLDERFQYNDSEVNRRVWKIQKSTIIDTKAVLSM